jgi:hypothetical protein
MSRLHPFNLVFGELAATRFGEIRALGSAAELRDRLRFQQLEAVQRLLADIAPRNGEPGRGAQMEEYGILLYAAYHYWDQGEQTRAVAPDFDATSAADRPPQVPVGACYIRLPERRFWAQVAPDAPHEPIDGVFVASSADGTELTVVAILGLRPDRGGFSQIAVSAPAADFASAARFRRDPPFAPTMEGGARAGFRSVVTEGELLHLAHLAMLGVTS